MCKDHTKLIMQSIKKLLFFVSILFTFGMAVNLAEAISKYLNENRLLQINLSDDQIDLDNLGLIWMEALADSDPDYVEVISDAFKKAR